MMNMKNLKPLIVSLCVTVFEFAAFLIWGFNLGAGNEMGFGLITTYFLFPITTLILAAWLGYENPVFLVPFAVIMFAAQNFMPFIIYGSFEIVLILCFTFIPASIGTVIGVLIKKHSKSKVKS